MADDDAKIIELLSLAARAETDRREIEADRLSVTYEMLAILTERRGIELRLEQIAALHLNVLQDAVEEMIALSRETKEIIALLLVSGDRSEQVKENLKTLVYQSGDRHEETEYLIMINQGRLFRLKSQAAKFGDLHAPAYIQTEIDDTERQIEELKAKLGDYGPETKT